MSRRSLQFWTLFSAILIVFLARVSRAQENDAQLALDRYKAESDEIARLPNDGNVRNAFYDKWLSAFLKMSKTELTPQDQHNIRIRILELANGTQRYDISSKMAADLYADASTYYEKIRWSVEEAEIYTEVFRTKDDATFAALAADRYRRVLGIFDENVDVEKERGKGAFDYYLDSATKLASIEKDYLNDYQASIAALLRGLSLIEKLEVCSHEYLHENNNKSLSKESFASAIMTYSAISGNRELSHRMMTTLSSIGDLRIPMSRYFLDYAVLTNNGQGVDFQKDVSAWISSHGSDDWTGNLRLILALSYLSSKRYVAAGPLLEDLQRNIDTYFPDNIKKDVEPQILYGLAVFYSNIGVNEQFSLLAEELLSRYPDHQLSVLVSHMLPKVREGIPEYGDIDLQSLSVEAIDGSMKDREKTPSEPVCEEKASAVNTGEHGGVVQDRRGEEGSAEDDNGMTMSMLLFILPLPLLALLAVGALYVFRYRRNRKPSNGR